MLDELKNLFQDGLQYTHTAGILQQLANLVNIVQIPYMKDVDGKNKALDLICELLQSHKEKPVEEKSCGSCKEDSICH